MGKLAVRVVIAVWTMTATVVHQAPHLGTIKAKTSGIMMFHQDIV